jgi:hypothetical protein
MFELHNAGGDDPSFHQYRLRFIDEFMLQFPEEDEDIQLNFGRGKGEALWYLGRQSESEQTYADLVARLPDEGWAYIGWSDHYWLDKDSVREYARAEEILLAALKRPAVKDRSDVLDRLSELYKEWGKPEKMAAVADQPRERQPQPKPQAAFMEKKTGKQSKRGRRRRKG